MFNRSPKEILKFLEDNRGKRFEANRKMGVKKTDSKLSEGGAIRARNFGIPQRFNFEAVDESTLLKLDDIDVVANMDLKSHGQGINKQESVLKRLSLEHALHYLFPDPSKDKKIYNRIINAIRSSEPKAFQPEIYEHILQRIKHVNAWLQHFVTMNNSTKLIWATPKFVYLPYGIPMPGKEDMHIVCPFFISNRFKTIPNLAKHEQYLLAYINLEEPPFSNTKFYEIYIRNLVLVLQKYFEENSGKVKGASIIFSGMPSKNLLGWFRGTPPDTEHKTTDQSPTPDVEIIYAIPKSSDSMPFLFTLKPSRAGAKLVKFNKQYHPEICNQIYQVFSKERIRLIVDELIVKALDAIPTHKQSTISEKYHLFMKLFWKCFEESLTPYQTLDIPNSTDLAKNREDLRDDLSGRLGYDYSLCLMSEIGVNGPEDNKLYLTIEDEKVKYRTSRTPGSGFYELEGDISQPNGELYQAIQIHNLDKLNKVCKRELLKILSYKAHIKHLQLTDDMLGRATKIAIQARKLDSYLLDWKHVIDDSRKEKNYTQSAHTQLDSLTPDILDRDNYYGVFHRGSAVFSIRNKSAQNPVLMVCASVAFGSANKFHLLNNPKDKFCGSLMEYALFDIGLIYAQLSNGQDEEMKKCSTQIAMLCSDVYGTRLYKFIRIMLEEINDNDEVDFSFSELISDMKTVLVRSLIDIGIFKKFFEYLREALKGFKAKKKNDITDKLSYENELFFNLTKVVLFNTFSLSDIFTLLRDKHAQYESFSPGDPNYERFHAMQSAIKYDSPRKTLHFFDVKWERENLLKYIYVIMQDKSIRIALEPLHVKNRPTHSELANAEPILAGGELVFRKDGTMWKLITVNNGSGHYRPPPSSLRVARDCISNILIANGINCDEALYCSALRPDLAIGSLLDEVVNDKATTFQPEPAPFSKYYRWHVLDDDNQSILQDNHMPQWQHFSFHAVAMNDDCGFTALGIPSRQHFVETLLANRENASFREQLSHDILQEIVQNASLASRLDSQEILSHLCTSYINFRDSGELEQAENIRLQLIEKCQEIDIYYHYVEYLGGDHIWLGTHSALCYALAKNIRLHIFSCDAQDRSILVRTHFNPSLQDFANEVFILFEQTGGGHFSLLQKIDAREQKLIASMQNFFKSENGSRYLNQIREQCRLN